MVNAAVEPRSPRRSDPLVSRNLVCGRVSGRGDQQAGEACVNDATADPSQKMSFYPLGAISVRLGAGRREGKREKRRAEGG